MKRNITKIFAAIMLLIFMMPALSVLGQTREALTLTFPLTSNPGGWPTANSTTLTNYTYTLDGVDYTFALKNVKCNSGYLMLTQPAVLGLPAIDGYKLTTVVASNSNGCSTSTKVGISSSATQASYIDGGAIQTWSTTGSSYTYTLTSTDANTMYYMYVTNKNAQIVSLALTYESVGGADTPSIAADNVNITYDATSGEIEYTINNPVDGGVLSANTTATWLNPGTVGTEAVPFTCELNEGAERSAIVTLTYTYNSQTVTKNVTITQTANPNAPGTENNPYTVAQARAAIDAETGTQGVYATGIVSAIPTEWSTQYNNITFNMVDEEGDEVFLQAYRCVSSTDVDASTVAVGDVVVVYGNLTKYGQTYEFAQGCEVVSIETPVITGPYITASNIEIEYNATNDTINYTINNPVTGGRVTAATDSDWLTLPAGRVITYACLVNPAATPRTATVTLTYTYNTDQTVTKDITVTQAGNPDVVNNISDITEVGTAYAVRGTVVATNSRGFVLGDGTGYVYYYKNAAPTQSVGDMVRVSGTTGTYGQIIQFTSSATVAESTYSYYDNTPAATVITEVPDYSNGYHLSTYFEFEGTLAKSSSSYFITLGEEQIQISYPTTDQGTALTALDGKTVHVKAYFAGINSNSKFTVMLESAEEVVSTTPVINTTAPETLAYDATSGEIAYEITNPVAGTSLNATTDAEWISNITVGESTITFDVTVNEGTEDRSATVTLTYAGADDKTVTVTQGHYVVDYAELPFEFDGGRADIENTNGLTQEGLDSDYNSSPKLKFNTTGDWVILHFNARPGTLTFDIKNNSFSGGTFTVQTSEDGVTYTDLENYTEIAGTQSEEFANLGENIRYIRWIYTEKSSGNVGLGNIMLAAYEAPVPAITVEATTITAPAEETDGTLNVTYVGIESVDIYWFESDGTTSASVPEWIATDFDNEWNINYLIDANDGEARTAYFKVYGLDGGANDIYSNLVTVSQAAPVAPVTGDKYVKVTSTDNLTDGQYLIVYEEVGLAFDGSLETLDAAGNTILVTINNDEIEVTNETTASEFTITAITDGYSIQSASGYYIGQTSDANGLQASDETEYLNAITFDEDNNADIVSSSAYLRFNSASNQARFRYYKSSSYTNQKAIQLYKKVEETPVTETYTLNITGYENASNSAGGYYLIASPVTVNPADVVGMTTTGNFDLYYFDESENNEWQNWNDTDETGHFNLVPGKGYLYAHKTGGTFNLTGVPYSGDGVITLQKLGNGNWSGWNLIGNPFGETAYIDGDRDFMVMNGDGSDLEPADVTSIERMQGVFVKATEDGETLTLSTDAPTNQSGKIVMNVRNSRGNNIDRAMIRFGEGRQLPKFMLNPANTKLYVAQNGEDFAVVRSINENTTPVSFKAAENGTYTLSVNVDNIEMEYLHLVDNMTGDDIDLLVNSSYTFEAHTTDYANRFNLVYATYDDVNENNAQPFSFFNGSEWVINNVGNATLQVVDVMGRVLRSEAINGNANVNLNQSAGIYMLRLVNGNDVKVQKIVVR